MMKRILLTLLLLASQFSLAGETSALQRAIAGEHRPAEHKGRDQYRHPEQTLNFFGVKEDMTVVEIWPGGDGWYTEILAPFLRDKGKLYAAHFSTDSEIKYFKKNRVKFDKKMKARPDLYGKVEVTVLNPPEQMEIAPEGSADRVLTFRNVHNWMKSGQAAAVFGAMFRALKPGGILGVVEHRKRSEMEQDPQALSGYVSEDHVVLLARKAGFEFLDKSEINANPNDDGNHPKGVWTLPPTLKLKDKDWEKYMSIGESDRMTLKFIKP